MPRTIVCAASLLALWPSPALAWNSLGHKVVADIAWQQLSPEKRREIVDVLRRHPRYAEDFAKKMPGDVDDARWTFQTAATWPDVIRGNKDYDNPTWHYVDFPLFIGPERPVTFNRVMEPDDDWPHWNVAQAIAYSRRLIVGPASVRDKAVAYCWLIHLVGDVHQPLHSTALVCERFPDGDKGGNAIPVVQGRNLHSLWDGLLGRRDRMADVQRAVAKLKDDPEAWKADVKTDVPAWIAESHELAKSVVYDPIIMQAVERPGELSPINLPESYLKAAGQHARERVTAAGLRLAAMLDAKP